MKGYKRWSQPLGIYASCDGEFEKFNKNFIDSNKSQYAHELIDRFREENNITVFKEGQPDEAPNPYLSFSDFPLGPPQFDKPTAIQSEVIPLILAGKNVVAIAQTGSGKTLAYLLPSLMHMAQYQGNLPKTPHMLVLVPTRELGLQTFDQLYDLTEHYQMKNLKMVCIYGGNPNKKQQVELLTQGVHIIIATPGRLLELVNECLVTLSDISYMVLDEADRMLDMGFEPQVREIVQTIRPDRQTVLFSATWPKEVQQLSKEFCIDPYHVTIGKVNLITQRIICLGQKEKLKMLMKVLDELIFSDKVLIFAETKKRCEQLSQDLSKENYFCISLHGDKTQEQRDAIMKQFKDSNTRLICATDIASRGLDVKDITVVVNYDFPKAFDDYIHRIGRTGRAGASGRSFSLLSYERDEGAMAELLINHLNSLGQEVTEDLMQFKEKALKAKQERLKRKLQQYTEKTQDAPNGVYPPNNFMQLQEQLKQEQLKQEATKQELPNQQQPQKKVFHKYSKSEYQNNKPEFQSYKNYNKQENQNNIKPEYQNNKPEYKQEFQKPEYKSEYQKHDYKPDYQKPEYKPDYQKPEYKPEYQKPEYKPDYQKQEYKPDYQKQEYKSDYQKQEYKPDYSKPDYKPEYQKPDFKPEYQNNLQNTYKPDYYNPNPKPEYYKPEYPNYKPDYQQQKKDYQKQDFQNHKQDYKYKQQQQEFQKPDHRQRRFDDEQKQVELRYYKQQEDKTYNMDFRQQQQHQRQQYDKNFKQPMDKQRFKQNTRFQDRSITHQQQTSEEQFYNSEFHHRKHSDN